MAAELLAVVAQTSWMVLIVSQWSQGASRNGLFFKRPFGSPVFLSRQRRNWHFHLVQRRVCYGVRKTCIQGDDISHACMSLKSAGVYKPIIMHTSTCQYHVYEYITQFQWPVHEWGDIKYCLLLTISHTLNELVWTTRAVQWNPVTPTKKNEA